MSNSGQNIGFSTPPAVSGQRVIDWINRSLRPWLSKTQAIPGVGLTSKQTQAGRVFDVVWSESAPSPFSIQTVSGRIIRITPGRVNATQITSADLTLAASSTLKIYIKLTLTAGPSAAAIKYRYDISTATIEDETDAQTDTGDSYAAEAGTAWFLIAEVTTDADDVTEIDQLWTGNLAWAWSSSGHLWGPRNA